MITPIDDGLIGGLGSWREIERLLNLWLSTVNRMCGPLNKSTYGFVLSIYRTPESLKIQIDSSVPHVGGGSNIGESVTSESTPTGDLDV